MQDGAGVAQTYGKCVEWFGWTKEVWLMQSISVASVWLKMKSCGEKVKIQRCLATAPARAAVFSFCDWFT